MSLGNLSRDEAALRSAQLEVNNYTVELDVRSAIDQTTEFFDVVCALTFTSTTQATWLDFVGGNVDDVQVNGKAHPIVYDGARVHLEDLLIGEPNQVVVTGRGRYSRSGQGLHRFVDPVDGQTYLYTHYEPADARRVFPNFEQPDLKASFSFRVRAPEGWLVLSNGVETATSVLPDGGVLHEFAPTKRLSTYINALVAGPYAYVSDEWVSPRGQTVALGLACRASLRDYLESEELFCLTKQGLSFYDEAFSYPYPWGKYDQVFVPEYNLGAMENPGCVLFTEECLYRSAATRTQRQSRSNTLQHEMAHMWFGDLVTPAWWDDLWLKESFAEFMGAYVNTVATEYTGAWVAFAGARKAWAYAQDQLPTTHPIVAEVPDLEAAKQAFDGITYAKGASALKQLVVHVGVEEFFAAARNFFAAHAFGSATLADFLTALEAGSGRDLAAWSKAWLEHPGLDTFTPTITVDSDQVMQCTLTRSASIPGPSRPHTFAVGVYRLHGDSMVLDDRIQVDFPADVDKFTIDALAGRPIPDLIVLNDRDDTFAKIRFDDHSLQTIRAHLSRIDDPLTRAVVWGALWNMVRDSVFPVADYVQLVFDHALDDDVDTLTALTNQVLVAIRRFLPAEIGSIFAEGVFARSWARLGEAAPSSDAQLLWARLAFAVAAQVPQAVLVLQRLLSGETVVDGLAMDHDLRWRALASLTALDEVSDAHLAEEVSADDTAEGRRKYLIAMSGRPSLDVKEKAWKTLHTVGAATNEQVDAMVSGFQVPGQGELLLGFVERYFDALVDVWRDFPIEIAQRLVRGLFPHWRGGDVADHPEVVAATCWLDSHVDAPKALRRIVIEELDELKRELQVQRFNAGIMN